MHLTGQSMKEGRKTMGKVTMQDIADALGISRVSVWKVFNEQAGVSDNLRDKVLEMANKLGYSSLNQGRPSKEDSLPKTHKAISLVVSRPDSASFWTEIIHSLAKELSLQNVNLIYTYIPSNHNNNFILPSILTGNEIDGIVTLNIYDQIIMNKINELELPKVFLDTVPMLTEEKLHCDLVLIEGKRVLTQLVDDLASKGIKRIGFIGDISYARTNFERYEGFISGLAKNNLPHEPAICFINNIGIFNYQNKIFEFLDSITVMPEAFMCVSDYVAQFVSMYISLHPEKFPKPIILTGFDGNKEYVNVADKITTANVQTKWLGRKLALQILYRMKYPSAPYETIYVHPEVKIIDSYFS